MGRCCAVFGCPSGKNSDKNLKKKTKSRQTSLFKVPKCLALMEKWNVAIGKVLSPSNYICELHFSKEDVIKEDKTIMSDGTTYSIPRQKYFLKKNAVPVLKRNKEKWTQQSAIKEMSDFSKVDRHVLEHDNVIQVGSNINEEESHNQSDNCSKKQSSRKNENSAQLFYIKDQQLANFSENQRENSNDFSMDITEQSYQEHCNSMESIAFSNDESNIKSNDLENHEISNNFVGHLVLSEVESCVNLNKLDDSQETYNPAVSTDDDFAIDFYESQGCEEFNDVDDLQSISSEFAMDVTEPQTRHSFMSSVDDLFSKEKESSIGKIEQYQDSQNFISFAKYFRVGHDTPSTDGNMLIQRNTDLSNADKQLRGSFSRDSLIDLLATSTLPEKWCWFTNYGESNSVILAYINNKSLKLQCHLEVLTNLSVTIVNSNVIIHTDIILSSFEQLYMLMKIVETCNFCVGTSIEDNRYACNCQGMSLPGEGYKKKMPDYRCIPCRQLRRTLQNRKNKRNLNRDARYARIKHNNDLIKRKAKRLQEQNKKLKQDMKEAKQKCAAVREDILQEVIDKLSPIQQEAVRACFDAAKLVNTKRRRYTLEWVYECLLMRIKNASLYEHLRQRNVLPLPCKDTLSKYIQKMDSAYGFQKSVFDCLRVRGSRMTPQEKRGTIYLVNYYRELFEQYLHSR